MMRIRFPAVVLLVSGVLSGCQQGGIPEADLDSEAELVRGRAQQLVEAENRKDLDAIMAFYAQDAAIQPPDAPAVQGPDAIRQLYTSFFRDVPFVSVAATSTALHVARGGDLAYETGINRFLLDKGGARVEEVGKYLAVWRKVDGEWRVAAVAFSSDQATPP